MRPSATIKYISLFLAYNGLLFFAMAFAPFSHWIDYSTGHYGIWRSCDDGDGCVLQGWSPEKERFSAQVIPRILMLVAFCLLLISLFFAYRGFKAPNAAFSFFISGIFQFLSSIFIVAAFVVSYFSRLHSDGKAKIAFQSVIGIVSGCLFCVGGMILLGLFCHQKLREANSVIVLDQKGRAEKIRGQNIDYYND